MGYLCLKKRRKKSYIGNILKKIKRYNKGRKNNNYGSDIKIWEKRVNIMLVIQQLTDKD